VTGPVIAGGVVHVVSHGGVIAAYDRRTGDLRWRHETGLHVSGDADNVHDEYTENQTPLLPGDGLLHLRTDEAIVTLA
jgi:outer membrane protein assembly factor BamB